MRLRAADGPFSGTVWRCWRERGIDAAELFTCDAHGLARALEEVATKSRDSRRAADVRRLSGRLFLLQPLKGST
jgi:hypothetical protein